MKKICVVIGGLAFAILSVMTFAERSIEPTFFQANIDALAESEGGQVVSCYCKTNWFTPNVCSVNADGGYCGGNPCSNHDGNCR